MLLRHKKVAACPKPKQTKHKKAAACPKPKQTKTVIISKSAASTHARGRELYAEKQREEGLRLYAQAAHEGHAEAMHDIAEHYRSKYYSANLSEDENQAVQWFTRAAAAGWSPAVRGLHEMGQHALAVKCATAIADTMRPGCNIPGESAYDGKAGYHAAQSCYLVAQLIDEGRDAASDSADALRWYKRAAAAGWYGTPNA